MRFFSDNREAAGAKYEQIRGGLVRFFSYRGCSDPESLTDETINRVARKADDFDEACGIRLTSFFYGFASNVLMEARRASKREVPLGENISVIQPDADIFIDDSANNCLQTCLAKLSDIEREIIVSYYGCERREKAEIRHKLCERFDFTAGALHTKVFRIKGNLRSCVDKCKKERKI